MRRSKNSRVGRQKEEQPKDVLPKYNPANVGTTWKTKCKGLAKPLNFDIKRKKGR